jgi:transcriptional regulator with XRE-family HTH domain
MSTKMDVDSAQKISASDGRNAAESGTSPPPDQSDKSNKSSFYQHLDPAETAEVGSRLKDVRRQRKLSIKTVAERSGLSTGLISQIERNRTTPSLRSLRLLSAALDVSPSLVFQKSQPRQAIAAEPFIVRKSKRSVLKLSGHVLKELLSPETASLMEVYEVTLKPGGSSGSELYSHAGEKAGVVVSGKLDLWLEDNVQQLYEGDVCQFLGAIPHRYCNTGEQDVRVIWIVTPPPP